MCSRAFVTMELRAGDTFGLWRLQLDSPNLGFSNQWEQQKTPSANSCFCSSIGNCLLNDGYFRTMHSDSVNNKKLLILVLNSPPEGHDVVWNEGHKHILIMTIVTTCHYHGHCWDDTSLGRLGRLGLSGELCPLKNGLICLSLIA